MKPQEEIQKAALSFLKYGFQALFIKDWEGNQGKRWELSTCAWDCACSPACAHCPSQKALVKGSREPATFLSENLNQPLGWLKRHVVFVCPQGDLFKEDDISDVNIAQVFAVMHWAHQNCYIVLTKRAERMGKLMNSISFLDLVQREGKGLFGEGFDVNAGQWGSNLIVGVSVEDQEHMWRAEVIPELPIEVTSVLFAAPLLGKVEIPSRVLRCLDWGGLQSGKGKYLLRSQTLRHRVDQEPQAAV